MFRDEKMKRMSGFNSLVGGIANKQRADGPKLEKSPITLTGKFISDPIRLTSKLNNTPWSPVREKEKQKLIIRDAPP